MGLFRGTLLAFIACSLVLFFQNCTRSPGVNFSDSTNKLSGAEDDSGRPYDGKIYILAGALCQDGSDIQSRIVVESSVSAKLVREACVEITPVALGPDQFQLNTNNINELYYQNQTYVNVLVGTLLPKASMVQNLGFSSSITFDAGTLADTTADYHQSPMQIYEDGKPLGAAHSRISDIEYFGMGRFIYKLSTLTNGYTFLRFSASDNSNPATNGRTYTYKILSQPPPSPAIAINYAGPAQSDATTATYGFTFFGTPQVFRLYLDTDSNLSTGYTGVLGYDYLSGSKAMGAEYMIENGNLYQHVGTSAAWNWTLIKAVTFSTTSNSVNFTVLKSDLGSPKSLKYMFELLDSSGYTSRSYVEVHSM